MFTPSALQTNIAGNGSDAATGQGDVDPCLRTAEDQLLHRRRIEEGGGEACIERFSWNEARRDVRSLPKAMVPRHSSETRRPDWPRSLKRIVNFLIIFVAI